SGGGGRPSAGTEGAPSRGLCHSFAGGARVLMGDGTGQAIGQGRGGGKIAGSVPGRAGDEVHAVQEGIVTRTGHHLRHGPGAPTLACVSRARRGGGGCGRRLPRGGSGWGPR